MATRAERAARLHITDNERQRFKRHAVKAGRCRCEVCGWAPPAVLALRNGQGLDVHHVMSSSCGGSDDPGNLTILCPNHHALAHAMSPSIKGRNRGIASRDELIAVLRLLDSDPEGWERDAVLRAGMAIEAALSQAQVSAGARITNESSENHE